MKKPTIQVIYNNSCSICRFEINHYKKQNTDTIQYLDLHQDLPEKLGSIEKAKLIRKLHVCEGDKIYVGVDAFKLILHGFSWILMDSCTILHAFH